MADQAANRCRMNDTTGLYRITTLRRGIGTSERTEWSDAGPPEAGLCQQGTGHYGRCFGPQHSARQADEG